MNAIVASSMNVECMGAQGVLISLFYVITPSKSRSRCPLSCSSLLANDSSNPASLLLLLLFLVLDSLNAHCQAFVPKIYSTFRERRRVALELAKDKIDPQPITINSTSEYRNAALQGFKSYIFRMVESGIFYGAFTSALVVSLIRLYVRIGGQSPEFNRILLKNSPLLAFIFSLHGFVCVVEGMFLGLKDLPFLAFAYGIFVLSIPKFMRLSAARATRLSLKNPASLGVDPGCLWAVFLFYNFARLTVWSLRLTSIWWREMRELKVLQNEENRLLKDNEDDFEE